MKNKIFRNLKANEIEVRLNKVCYEDDKKTPKGAIFLLWKNPQATQSILDDYGIMNWSTQLQKVPGSEGVYCTLSIYDKEKNCWVSKTDVGTTKSVEEKTKGEATDSLQRAASLWGIGRELYSAPFIYIPKEKLIITGEYVKTKLVVTEIAYDENDKIIKLIICDDKGTQLFYFKEKATKNKAEETQSKKATSASTINIIPLDGMDKIVTVGPNKGKTVLEVYNLNSASALFELLDDPEVKDVAKNIIDNNKNLSEMFKKRIS